MDGSILADRYELIKTIGEGGMGCVFMARHRQVGRICAVKVLRTPKEKDPRTYKRFLQEAKIAGSLSHPNLTPVYDYGETEDGFPFIVMDFVDGVSLKELLSGSQPLDLSRAVSIFLQICSGLSYAHEQGLIHRDLKPANIMLVKDNGQERIRIVDFGIAKIFVASGDQQEDLTKTGEIFGSPFYISPEYCLGRAVDARSDIYSLGCVMYEALTGHKPIEGENTIHTILMHVQEPPQPFAEVCPDQAFPGEIERIVLKCMEKKPEDRYQPLTEVASDLSRLLESLSSSAQQKTSASEREHEPSDHDTLSPSGLSVRSLLRRRGVLAGAILVVLGGIGLACLLAWPEKRPVPPAPLAPPVVKTGPTPPIQQGAPTAVALGPQSGTSAPAVEPSVIEESSEIASPAAAVREQEKHPDASARKAAEAVEHTGKAGLRSSPVKTGRSESSPRAVAQGVEQQTAPSREAAQSQVREARRRLARLQTDVLPRVTQEVDAIAKGAISWDVDWASFEANRAALGTFEHYGLEAIRDAISESYLVHRAQLKDAIRTIKVVAVPETYQREVLLKQGVLIVRGAWGQGINGSPSALEIRLAIESAL